MNFNFSHIVDEIKSIFSRFYKDSECDCENGCKKLTTQGKILVVAIILILIIAI